MDIHVRSHPIFPRSIIPHTFLPPGEIEYEVLAETIRWNSPNKVEMTLKQ